MDDQQVPEAAGVMFPAFPIALFEYITRELSVWVLFAYVLLVAILMGFRKLTACLPHLGSFDLSSGDHQEDVRTADGE